MTIIDRYVFRQAATLLLIILLPLTGFVWIATALRELNLVTSQGQDAWMFLRITTLTIPNFLAIIAPFALLIAIIQTLNRLNGDSELIVLTACGATIWTVARPILALSLLVVVFVGFINHIGMPWSLQLLRELITEVRTDIITQVIQPGQFNTPEPRLTFHIRDRARSGELLGLLVEDDRNPAQPMTYMAERAAILKDGTQAFLIMKSGHIHRVEARDRPPQLIAFDSYAVDLARFEKKGDTIDIRPRERYTSDLLVAGPNDPNYQRTRGQIRSELHERIAGALYPLAFVLIALAFVGQAQSTRTNRGQALVLAAVASGGLRGVGLAINNIVAVNATATPLLYALPLAGSLVALLYMISNARPHRQSRLGAALEASNARTMANLAALGRALGRRLGLTDPSIT